MADLDNKARYESYGASASFQFSSSGNNSANASQTGQGQNAESSQGSSTDASKGSTTQYGRNYGVSLPQFGSAKGTTSSAIAEGSLEIRSGENVDVSRDTANANGSIGKIFDKGEVTRNAELSQTVGQVAFTAVGDLASKMQSKSNAEVAAAIQERSKYEEGSEEYAEADQRVTDALKSSESWADGGKYRVALHAAAGALVASAGGGSLASGAAVGAGNEMLVAELGDLTKDMPDSERRNLLKLASSVAGAAIASATGGSASDIGLGTNIAASATEYNYLSHDQIKEMRRQLSTCQKNGCSDKQLQDIIFQYVVTSAKSDVELKKCIVSNDAACINKHVENMKSVSTDDLMLLATLDNWTNNSSLTDLQYQDKIKASIAQGDKGAGNWGYLLAGVLYPVRTAAGVASIPINAVNEFKVLIKAAAGDESARAQAQQILSKQGINAVFPGSVAADVVRGYMEQLDAADAAEKRGDINQAAYIRTSVAIDIASLLVPVAGSVASKADVALNAGVDSVLSQNYIKMMPENVSPGGAYGHYLFDGGVDIGEARRLAIDPAKSSKGNQNVSFSEASVAVELQDFFGGKLERFDVRKTGNTKPAADFVFTSGPLEGETVDVMFSTANGTPKEISGINRYFSKYFESQTISIQKHLDKASIVPLDTRFLTTENKAILIDYVKSLPVYQQKKIIILE